MDRTYITNYKNWIDKSPIEVGQWVVDFGGWSAVFPPKKKLEKPWNFSRVRNYFNSPWPKTLQLVDQSVSKILLENHSKKYAEFFDDYKAWIAEHNAHAGIVYRDVTNRRIWFQLGAGGVGYHYKKSHSSVAAVVDDSIGQMNIPVFKLVSPDPTGGSSEICIHNYLFSKKISMLDIAGPFARSVKLIRGSRQGYKKVTRYGKVMDVKNKHVIKPEFRGSYNYAETVTSGFSAHKRLDIDTHRTDPKFYVNPDPFSQLASRKIPDIEKLSN